jgi:hypothetical protein
VAELTTTIDTTANSCCAPEAQARCCEPSAKTDCCGHDESCGCDASNSDIRETARERYADAAT